MDFQCLRGLLATRDGTQKDDRDLLSLVSMGRNSYIYKWWITKTNIYMLTQTRVYFLQRELLDTAQAAQAYSLYFVWNFGSELFVRLCMGIYQIFQNSRICAEMLK